jgi:Zn-dependent peptidase ImmA (M78 family)
MNFGELKFDLNWGRKFKRGEPSTTADLSVFVDGEAVWPVEGMPEVGLDIQVDDLLAYLSEFWKPIVLRQTYPIPITLDRPSHLRAAAESRWESQPSEVVEREDELVCNFEDAHNLSRCFAGMFDLPPLWLLRTNDRLVVDTQSKFRTVSFQQAYREFSRIGDEISAHLSHKNAKWERLVDGWKARDVGSPKILLAWSTSLDKEVAWQFATEGILNAPANVAEAANDDDELRIAARMASALPTNQIRQILNLVRGFEHHKAPKLDELGASASNHVNENFAHFRAHEQGEAAANFVRQHLGFSSNTYVDIFDVVETLGAGLYEEDVEPNTLDALAVWGGKFGPAVLLNSNSRRATKRVNVRRNWAARVTLAHELCHLLLDRGHALGAVDVLNSKMPRAVESRAKSFAGQFLLPSNVAAEVWTAADAPESQEGLSATIKTLQATYGVPKSVAAWKLDHGLQRRGTDLTVLLDIIAPFR